MRCWQKLANLCLPVFGAPWALPENQVSATLQLPPHRTSLIAKCSNEGVQLEGSNQHSEHQNLSGLDRAAQLAIQIRIQIVRGERPTKRRKTKASRSSGPLFSPFFFVGS